VFTYLGNMVAERVKRTYSTSTTNKCKFITKIMAPCFAVVTLFVITGFIASKAISVLLHPPEEDSVDPEIMYTFAGLNFIVDIICMVGFAVRGKEVFFEARGIPQLSLDTSVHSEGSDDFGHLDDDLELEPIHSPAKTASLGSLLYSYYCCPCSSSSRFSIADEKNLNMLSAFTHIGGDTLRTISVFLAALISTLFGINSDICDAWAAILVSVTIVLIMIPLIQDIVGEISRACSSWSEYGGQDDEQEYLPVSIQADEESEPLYRLNTAADTPDLKSLGKPSPGRKIGNRSPNGSDSNLAEYGSVKSDNAATGTTIAAVAAKMKAMGNDSDRIDDYLFVDDAKEDDDKLLF
jgi:Co/Zn/Cd efflux system component